MIKLLPLSGTYRQYVVALSCQMSVMMAGVGYSWFTPLLDILIRDTPMTLEQSSWMISCIELSQVVSSILAGILVDRLGRKMTLLISFPLTALSYVIVVSTKSYAAFVVVRLLQGLTIGLVFTVAPIYLAEIAEPKIRGALCGNFQTMWLVGTFYAIIAGTLLPFDYYVAVSASSAVIFIITFIWVPESPYYFLINNREHQARKSLMFLRATHKVDQEIVSIKNSLEVERSNERVHWKDLFTDKSNRRGLMVVTGLSLVKYMGGSAIVSGYFLTTLAETSTNKVNNPLVTVVVGVVAASASLVSSYTSDKVGRKPLMIISTVGTILFNVILGIYYLLLKLKIPYLERYSWVAYSSLGAYTIVSNVGLSSLLPVLQAEYFPSRIRGKAGAFVTVLGDVMCFICLKQYQSITYRFGLYVNYFSFSLYSILGSVVIFAFFKETAGKSLTEIPSENDKKKITNLRSTNQNHS